MTNKTLDGMLFLITTMRPKTKCNNGLKFVLCKAGVLFNDAAIFSGLCCINGK
jgi:hypothetical protein